MKKRQHIILALLSLLVFFASILVVDSKSIGDPMEIQGNTYTSDWESLQKHKTPQWFKDGKFGIYFHWGVYSVPAFGTEWYPRHMYLENHKGWGSEVRPHHIETYGA